MKKLLIGSLALFSLSAFSATVCEIGNEPEIRERDYRDDSKSVIRVNCTDYGVFLTPNKLNTTHALYALLVDGTVDSRREFRPKNKVVYYALYNDKPGIIKKLVESGYKPLFQGKTITFIKN